MRDFFNKLIIAFGATILLLLLALSPIKVAAEGSLTVTPNSNLSNNQTVSITGSGFAESSTGAILECNSDPNQPTVTFAGNQVPVSCSSPLSNLVTTTSSGSLNAVNFKIITGTVGPPNNSIDSASNPASTDAALYPCPPTAQELAQGYYCEITFGDAANDNVSVKLNFVSALAPTTTSQNPTASSPATPTTTSQNPTASSPATPTTTSQNPTASRALPNTGPGNVIALFVIIFLGSTLGYRYLIIAKHNSR
jgi:hypothetical protein